MGLDIYFFKGKRSTKEANAKKVEEIQKKIDAICKVINRNTDTEMNEPLNEIYNDYHDQRDKLQPKEAAYFRKVNFLVRFFDYEDDCSSVEITKDKVDELVKACEAVIADHSKASELLPTTDGFFFGGTEYDEYYFEDVKDVLTKFKKLAKMDFDKEFLEMYCWW